MLLSLFFASVASKLQIYYFNASYPISLVYTDSIDKKEVEVKSTGSGYRSVNLQHSESFTVSFTFPDYSDCKATGESKWEMDSNQQYIQLSQSFIQSYCTKGTSWPEMPAGEPPSDKGGSSSGSDSDSGSSARTLGNLEIKSAFLGTTPNIIVNLNFLYSFMRTIRKAVGRAVPSPEIVHSAIWVGDANPSDNSVGAVFTYGRYFNKNNNKAFLWDDGAKGYTMTFKQFKNKFNAANPMKLNLHKNIKLLDFIDQIKDSGKWGVKDYNWPTNNCQHFTAKLINILEATRESPNNNDWIDIPKLVLESLKSNEEKKN
ncbi:hypothetical protein M9Y10_029853 [Tritrichomonas musculus]|uniref:PPPDE domain-containing protein n=1 Tax=Tritrichomonas musculus TaxID=1915356 RepID=A0ABR2KN79_9EUKA